MDIFNHKRIAELEKKLALAELERDRYKIDVSDLTGKFSEMAKLEETMPSDCVKGPWCKACEFVKTFHHSEYYGLALHRTVTVYCCGKGESCKNFVQRED